MVSNHSASSTSVNLQVFGSFASEMKTLSFLSLKERDNLVREMTDYLESELRNEVFKTLDISILSQFLMPSQSDYDDLLEFQRAASDSRKLFETIGLFEVTEDGKIIDHNDLYRPLMEDGVYYSKMEDGPAVLEA